jgi:hypothetical protein
LKRENAKIIKYMLLKAPKNDAKYHWTNHVVMKMAYYGLSESRVKRVLRAPVRSELGVAENTIAVMQPVGTKKRPAEIWVMYQKRGAKKVIITAWRYPGVSPIRDQIPIPQDILAELREAGFLNA